MPATSSDYFFPCAYPSPFVLLDVQSEVLAILKFAIKSLITNVFCNSRTKYNIVIKLSLVIRRMKQNMMMPTIFACDNISLAYVT